MNVNGKKTQKRGINIYGNSVPTTSTGLGSLFRKKRPLSQSVLIISAKPIELKHRIGIQLKLEAISRNLFVPLDSGITVSNVTLLM